MIDNVSLLPAYLAAATAVAVLVVDLLAPGQWRLPLVFGALGAFLTGGYAILVGTTSHRSSFCLSGGGCSYRTDAFAALIGAVFAALTLGVLAISVPVLRAGDVPAGEYCFLLACSMTGGVVLASARDLILLVVAVETVTLPLYALVGLRRAVRSAEASVTFFLTSVVSTAVALLGAALLYAATGTVHLSRLPGALADGGHPAATGRLIPVGIVLLIAGLAFKVAAVPLHGWAPATYDGAPLPVTAYLSTASKLAGIVALGLITMALKPRFDVVGLTFAILSALTMTVGNLVALRQRRMVRLLAWSSIAQAGYVLAPLGALALVADGGSRLVAATLAYTLFFLALEFGAFATLVAVRGAGDGGTLSAYRGLARRSWWAAAALVLALTGLAGLPPGLAGLFAKVVVVQALIGTGATWLAVVVALNAVVGLAYYARVVATLFAAPSDLAEPASPAEPAVPAEPAEPAVSAGSASPSVVATRLRVPWPVVGVVALVAVGVLVVGFAPQYVLDSALAAVKTLP